LQPFGRYAVLTYGGHNQKPAEGGKAMNLNGIIQHEEIPEKAFWRYQVLFLLRSGLGQFLNMIGAAIFWLYMIALLVSPIWVPLLVNRVLTH
jgi:hypothetical protein